MTAIALLIAVSLSAAPLPSAKPPRPQAKIWFAEDVEALAVKGGITTFEVAEEQQVAVEVAPVTLPREKDSAWYREQIEARRKEIAQLESGITTYRRFLRSGEGGFSGLRLDQPNIGITPESSIWLLEGRARQLRGEISELEDNARRNSVAPGALR